MTGDSDDSDAGRPTCDFEGCEEFPIGEYVIESERGGEIKTWNRMFCESHLEAFRKGQFSLQADDVEVYTV